MHLLLLARFEMFRLKNKKNVNEKWVILFKQVFVTYISDVTHFEIYIITLCAYIFIYTRTIAIVSKKIQIRNVLFYEMPVLNNGLLSAVAYVFIYF